MSEEPLTARRRRNQALEELAAEDLELLGAMELAERIGSLEAEIARVRVQIARKDSTRAAADALFNRRE